MTQAGSLLISGGADQSAALTLRGGDLGAGSANGTGNADPDDDIFSIAAGVELQATSGLAPPCTGTVTTACYRLPEERDADLAYVGYTSDYPAFGDPSSSLAYFAVATHGPWSIPSDKVSFQFDIDVDGDGAPDLYLYSTRLTGGDVFVATLADADGNVIGSQGIDARLGDVDAALYDSDAMLLPVALDELIPYGVTAAHPRISYGVEAYSGYSTQPIDLIGVDPDTRPAVAPAQRGSLRARHPGHRARRRRRPGGRRRREDADRPPAHRQLPGRRRPGRADAAPARPGRRQGAGRVPARPAAGDRAHVEPAVAGDGRDELRPVGHPAAAPPVRSPSPRRRRASARSPARRPAFLAAGTCTITADQAGDDDYDAAPTVTQSFAVVAAPPPPAATTTTTTTPPPIRNPRIAARVSSAHAKSRYGWYHTAVTVSFTCTPGTAPLAGACPKRVKLTLDGRGRSVSRTITARDGGSAAVTVRSLNIDRTAPSVRITGVHGGATYRRKAPAAHCAGRDSLSKVASCRIARRRTGRTIRYTATATDRAGNVRAAHVTVHVR